MCDLSVTFRVRQGRAKRTLTAVDRVSLTVGRGEIVGLVGESGSGKSTVARAVSGLNQISTGTMRYDGAPLTARRTTSTRRSIQMVFQDPFSSLNPSMTVRQHLTELLRVHHVVARGKLDARCCELMDLVGLPNVLLDVRPRRMSGGQRQRVAIARALAVEPRLLVADEAVSALDVSVQAGIVNLFADLREKMGLSILFIAHDLAVVRNICDTVSVIYMGRIVEQGATEDLFESPQHPYTQGLLAAVPRLDGRRRAHDDVKGDPPSLLALPTGCRFRSRCPEAVAMCGTVEPVLAAHGSDSPGHLSACHLADADRPNVGGY
jgi:oligopeptide/dipeptide ABC transporter ATP-binding protein